MFKNAIVRKPCKAMIEGLSDADLGEPDFEKACAQHDDYIEALKECGLEVMVLEANEDYPDSCFVEDPALMTPHCAILTNPGAISRRGEVARAGRRRGHDCLCIWATCGRTIGPRGVGRSDRAW